MWQASLFSSFASSFGYGLALLRHCSGYVLFLDAWMGFLSQDIAGDAFFVVGMNKHADKAWVNDLLM